MKLTVLLDDALSVREDLRAVHGLSYFVETPGGAVLLCKADGDQDRPNLPAP